MDEYFAYRIFLVDADQRELFSVNITKRRRLLELIKQIEKKGKVEFIDNNFRYLFCFVKEYSNKFFILQFAKEEAYSKLAEGEKIIESIEDKRYPFIYLFIDTTRQIILIEHKSTMFRDIDIPKSKIEKYFSANFKQFGIVTKIQEISSEITFWEQLQQYDAIYSFDITLSGPNLFGARYRASELAKDIHENYNASEFNIKLKNAFGKLKLLKDNISDYIKLAAAGAGKFVVEVAKKGIKEKIGSFTYILKKHYDRDINKISEEQLNNDFEDLDKHNDEKK